MVIQADLFHAQYLGPNGGDPAFQFGVRRHVFTGLHVDRRQRLAVQLAIRAQGHLCQQHPLRRYHVVRQVLGQVGAQYIAPIITRVLQHQIAHQGLAAYRQHRRLADPVVLQQARFDFTQLDALAAQLDLMVDTPGVLDHAVFTVACQVAGAVQAFAFDEWVRDKALGRECRPTVITTGQANTAQVQLAQHTDRDGREVAVKDVATEVGNRASNRYRIAAFIDTCPVGHIDGRFGRTVQVEEPGFGQLGEDLLLGINRQRFAAAHEALQALAARYRRILQERLQHRRHKVQRGDLRLIDQVDQPGRITVIARRRDHQARAGHQRPEKLPHRHVKAERGLLQHAVAGVQCIGFLHPLQAVGQCRVPITGAFGLPGGA
ncbi:hypothetical protein [Pseudomonas sp. 24 E 1]|nr:hypothetical protein [Pseudomonas sp. 24 E 1]CRM74859.1 hypothetical protein [Pseudomonas sp. 52 E 6]